MERQFYLFIAFLCLLTSNLFGQRGVSRIYTDYNGFWTSSQSVINPVKPDNRHNLLGFTWDGITYSTGVNDGLLSSRGINFRPGLYQAFPVANIPLNGLNQNYVALGYKEDGNDAGGRYPYTVPVKISDILTRGISGLDLGSGITNIPASAEPLLFNFGAVIDPTQINDRVPDLLISQIASPGSNNLDRVWFEDAGHNRVGREVIIDMSDNQLVPSVGNWTLDLYSPVTGVLASARTDRPIRIWAADVSLFGIDASNYTQPLYLRYKLGGSSDPAFLAFNRKFIEIITADDDAAFTEINTPVNIDVLENDGPATVLSPSSLRVLQTPQHGTATVVVQNGTYLIRYQPAPGYEGTDSFTYQVSNNAPIPSTDDAVVNLTVGSADVSVVKAFFPSVPFIGDQISFTLTVKNNGTGTAKQVVLTDLIPDGYTYISSASSGPAVYNPLTGTLSIGTLAAGEQVVLQIRAKVNPAGNYTNTALVTASSRDNNLTNNTSAVTPVPVLMSDLSVTKSVNLPAPLAGSTVIFIITAKNSGPSEATGVKITDLLPSGYTFISASPSVGTYSPATGIWQIGQLASPAAADYRIPELSMTAMVNPTGNYLNTAVIEGDQPDQFPANNTAAALTVPVQVADLSVEKTLDNSTLNTNTALFKVTVTNNGPGIATNVVLRDRLPTGYSYTSSNPQTGLYDPQTGEWKFNSLAVGASAVLEISSTLNATGNYRNTATVASDAQDPFPANNTDDAVPEPLPPTGITQQTFCESGQPAVADLTAVGNAIKWYAAPAGGTALSTTVQLTDRSFYYATQTIAGTESIDRFPVQVFLTPAPPAPALANTAMVSYCLNIPAIPLVAIALPGNVLLWYRSPDGGLAELTAPTPDTNTPGLTTYYVSQRNISGCEGARTAIPVVVNAIPAAPVSGGDLSACEAEGLILTATASTAPGFSIIWYNLNDQVIPQPVLSAAGTVTYFAAARNDATGCLGTEKTAVRLTIHPAPPKPLSGGNQAECPASPVQTLIATATTDAAQMVIWYDAAGGGNRVDNPILNRTGTITYYAAAKSSATGCESLERTPVTLTIYSPVDASWRVEQPTCDHRTGNVYTTAAAGSSFTLSGINPGSVPVTNTTGEFTGLQPGAYLVTVTNEGGCTYTSPELSIHNPVCPSVSLTKSADNQVTNAGDIIIYTIMVKNTGNVPLTSLQVTDMQADAGSISPAAVDLAAGETAIVKAQHTLTQAEAEQGKFSNQASVTGFSPDHSVVTDPLSDDPSTPETDDPTVVLIPSAAAIALIKTGVVTGNSITYTFTATNTGNRSLNSLKFSDDKLGLTDKSLDGILYPGNSISFEEVYQLTQADRELGSVRNTAIIYAVTQTGAMVSDRSGTAADNDMPTILAVNHAPVAVNDKAETKANSPVVIDILQNDDAAGSRFDPSSILITSAPIHGTVRINGDGTVTYTPLPGFTGQDSFIYRVSDIDGYQTNSAVVSIIANFFDLLIPNTFTPNGDGINDFFTIVGLNQYAENELSVVSRWGSEVYRKKDYDNNWSGEGLAEGTYFYLLKVKRKGSRQAEVLKGWILLKRAYHN